MANEIGYEVRAVVMAAGFGGIHQDLADESGLCGAHHITVSIPDRRLTSYLGEVVEGGWIVDERPALLRGNAVAISWNAPMVNVNLKDDEVERCPEPDPILLFGLQGEFRQLAALRATNDKFTGLDSVSPAAYAAYWLKHGARVGRRVGDKVVWADGSETVIPSFEKRWEVSRDEWLAEEERAA